MTPVFPGLPHSIFLKKGQDSPAYMLEGLLRHHVECGWKGPDQREREREKEGFCSDTVHPDPWQGWWPGKGEKQSKTCLN